MSFPWQLYYHLSVTAHFAFFNSLQLILLLEVILFTDKRCLVTKLFTPQKPVTNAVSYDVCISLDTQTSTCQSYNSNAVVSTYTPTFEYHGDQCVSA